MVGVGFRWDRPIAAPIAHDGQADDDRTDHQPRVTIGNPPERDIAEDDSGGGKGKELPQVAPLGVTAIREYRDEITEDQQRQDDSARLLTAGKYMREQGHRKNAEAGDAALRHANHKGAENGEYPLNWFERHDSAVGAVPAEAIMSRRN